MERDGLFRKGLFGHEGKSLCGTAGTKCIELLGLEGLESFSGISKFLRRFSGG